VSDRVAHRLDGRWFAAGGVLCAGVLAVPVLFVRPAPVPSAPPVVPEVMVVVTEVRAPVTTPQLTTPALNSPAPRPRRPVALVARAQKSQAAPVTAAAVPSQKPLTRRLARFITGDGRYDVRPFPTVAPQRRSNTK
jgi:hypothetical protein